MSEMSIQDDGSYKDGALAQRCGYDTSLLGDCDELVGLIAKSNSPDGPYNSVEARNGSEADFAVARRQQAAIINRVEYLAVQITDRAATSDDEIEGKIHALDALTSVASWERDSLWTLRVSIDRDRAEVTKALHLPLVSIREHLESAESVVIHSTAIRFAGRRRCGPPRTAVATIAESFAIPVT